MVRIRTNYHGFRILAANNYSYKQKICEQHLKTLVLLLEIFSIEFHIVFVEQSYLTQPFFCYLQLYRGLILHVAIEEGLNYRRQGKRSSRLFGGQNPCRASCFAPQTFELSRSQRRTYLCELCPIKT